MTDGTAMKGKKIIIPFLLKKQILQQLHHMGIEKMWHLACALVYYININTDIKHILEQCATCMEYQQTKPCDKTIPYEMPYKTWEVVGADAFTVKNNILLCIVDIYSKFPVVKKEDCLWLTTLFEQSRFCLQNLGFQRKYFNK